MPYIPSGSTASQRNAFAQRLYLQLLSPDARKNLMSVREAFARAGGFPDAHAAEQAIHQDSVWSNPLLFLGKAPAAARPAYRFLGIHPSKLFDWAKISYKKHQPLLSTNPFSLDLTKVLLTHLWSHSSWEDALLFKRHRSEISTDMVFGKNLEDLRQNAEKFGGLYMCLGQKDNEFFGMSRKQALLHTMLIDDNKERRHHCASQWVQHRVNSNDGVFLLDAGDGSVFHHAKENAQHIGRNIHCWDFTQDKVDLSFLQCLSTGSWAQLWCEILIRPSDTPEIKNDIINWISKVCIQQKKDWDEKSCLFESMLNNLQKPHSKLPNKWKQRFDALNTMKTTKSQVRNIDNYTNDVVLVRLPSLLNASPHSLAHVFLTCALNFHQYFIVSCLSEPIEVSYKDVIEKPSHQNGLCNVHIDVPMHLYGSGEAVLLAQSRSMGSAILRVGSTQCMPGQDIVTKSIISNTNTKIFHGPTKSKFVTQDVEENQGVVVFKNEEHVFHPFYTA